MGIPDADIYPTATGAALETVKKHQEEADLVFYAGKQWNIHWEQGA